MHPARPELLGLLEACKQDPEDDTPRLVLADWLEDHGDGARAQLTRLQCRAARMSHRERRHQRVDQRVRALERACEAGWLRPLHERGLAASFGRGLLRVTAPLGAHRRAEVRRLAEAELWASVESLGVNGAPWGLPGLQGWLSSGLCVRLTSLSLGSVILGEPESEALAGAELPLLRDLQLYFQHLRPAGLGRLARAPFAAALDSLALPGSVGNRLGPSGAAALAAGSWGGLRRLDLQTNSLGDTGAECVAAAAWAGRLHHLNLQSNDIGPRGARTLLHGPRALSPGRVLLSGNPLGDAGAAVLAAAPLLADAKELTLTECDIGPAGAAALAGAPGLAGLTLLILYGNRVGDAGAAALARTPHLANLIALHLSRNGITSAGARALLAAHLPRLKMLILQANSLGEGVGRALRERFGPGVSVWL
jgi:uncharacterized protein (TIGR02996 family)